MFSLDEFVWEKVVSPFLHHLRAASPVLHGTDAYLCLPVNWMGICALAFLTPQINTGPNNQTLTVPVTAHARSKRAIQFIPLLAGLGITAGTGMGIGGIASSTTFYHMLYKDFTDDIERVAKSLVALQAN